MKQFGFWIFMATVAAALGFTGVAESQRMERTQIACIKAGGVMSGWGYYKYCELK